jgi:hypothetical protein
MKGFTSSGSRLFINILSVAVRSTLLIFWSPDFEFTLLFSDHC